MGKIGVTLNELPQKKRGRITRQFHFSQSVEIERALHIHSKNGLSFTLAGAAKLTAVHVRCQCSHPHCSEKRSNQAE